MKVPLAIPKERKLNESEDYGFLRERGLALIERLASDIWTDYNVHDPGITLLEALCYAITDLGHRTGFEVKDILATEGASSSKAEPPIFTAREILTNNPWTTTDWRKLLVDIDGIRNAWLFVADCQEVDFYAECKSSELKYFAPDHKIKPEKLNIDPQGNSRVLIDFINDTSNTETERIILPLQLEVFDNINNITTAYRVEVPLPGWAEVENRRNSFLNFINLDTILSISLLNVNFDNTAAIWQGDILINFNTQGNNHQIRFSEVVIEGVTETAVRDELEVALTTVNSDNIILQYQQYLLRTLARLSEHTIQLRGLFEVLLEYEVDDQYGDLNSGLLDYTLTYKDGSGDVQEADVEVLMPSWREVYGQLADYFAFINSPEITSVVFENENPDAVNSIWTVDLVLQYDGQDGLPGLRLDNLKFKGIGTTEEVDAMKANIELLDARSLIGFYHGKLKRLMAITEVVEDRLHAHRNLCEDFKKITSICVNEVAVCADIILENDANLLEVQAEILFQVQQYMSPPIRFYSLEEMVAMGIPSEDIFNGPPLNHGFVIDEEIEASELKDKYYIYASDIINLIMDVDGVLAVKDLLLTKYDQQGNAVLPSERWCVLIDHHCKAELSIDKSKLLYFKDGLPYILPENKEEELLKKIARKRAIAERYKLESETNDFPFPEGRPLPLDDYQPLRHLLPQTYGIGVEGLPETATPARKGKAAQLKGFLAFFDQLLANYLSQLSNLRELFSLDEHASGKLKKTYYARYLEEELLGENLYANPAALEDAAGTEIGPKSLQRLFESHADYLDRRNRFLDHLLARFAESFSDYALLVFQQLDEDEMQELIHDKISFLKEYPIISSQRGKGFNYKNESELWDTDNVAGLKKRMSKLLGMEDYLRKDLHCETIRNGFQVVEVNALDFTFKLEDGGTDILTSPKHFTTFDEAFYAMEAAIALAVDAENYTTEPAGAQHIFQIAEITRHPVTDAIISKDVFLESEDQYTTDVLAAEAGEALRQEIAADFDGEPCEVEGFHLIEHILLRPKNEYEDLLFEVCLNQDCFFCGEEDPYSFRVTIVLPYWMEKFIDEKMKIREYVNRLFRQEAPAHIHVKICWINNSQMRLLDLHYRRWLEENAKRFPDKDKLTQRLNALVSLLGSLRNVYFQGFLHDCDDSKEENTIILGKSFLGTYQPPPDE
ncbi:MAG: hypothetical protein KDD01_02530 [Phaeodactylibacter sp.]|nr:hypothetical protein [Phaeodactylibacter sp.]